MEMAKKYFFGACNYLYNKFNELKSYLFWGEFEKKHILFEKNGNQIRLVVKSHGEFTEEVQNNIEKYKNKKDEEKYIKYALEKAMGGCVYIVISKGEKFVQFWTNGGRLEFDFPIVKGNGNKKFYYQVIGLLADMDFVRDSFVPSQIPNITKVMPNHTYKIEVEGESTFIKGYFNKMKDKAAKFTDVMFKEIYKNKKEKLEFKVG